MRVLAALLLSLPLVAHNCVSQTDGSWSSAGTWTNCAGNIPGSGDTARVQHTVTITADIGSIAAGATFRGIKNIQIAGGVLLTDGTAKHTIYFGSTGTDPVGSGTPENPGPDANMFGFLVDAGSLDFSAATANAPITLTTPSLTAIGGKPVFIRHIWGGGGFFTGANVKLKYMVLRNLGIDSLGFEGVHVDGSNDGSTLSVDHCYFISPYIAILGMHVNNTSITFNSFTGARGPQTVYMFDETGWTVADNTEINPASDGVSFYSLYPPSGLKLLRNAALSSAAFSRTLFEAASDDNMTSNDLAQYNIAEFIKTDDSNARGIVASGSNGFFTIADSNVIQDAFQGIYGSGPGLMASNNVLTTSGPNYNGQGMIFVPNVIVNASGNMLALDDSNQGNIGILTYNGATQISTRNTVVMMNPDSGNSVAICACEPGFPSVNSLVKNNITEFGSNGVPFSDGSTFISDYHGAGVHHNDIVGTTYPYGQPETTHGNGFDDGTTPHPNAVYGDISINPGLIDSGRRLETYDAFIGGPGTANDLFAGLANRCGLTGKPWTPAYDPLKIYNWMKMGFAPTEIRLATVADDGGYVGALKPVGVIGAFIP